MEDEVKRVCAASNVCGRPPLGTPLWSPLLTFVFFEFFLSVSVALLLLHVAPPPPLSSLRSPSTHSTPPLSALHSFALSLSLFRCRSLCSAWARTDKEKRTKSGIKRLNKTHTQENISLNMLYKTFEDLVTA